MIRWAGPHGEPAELMTGRRVGQVARHAENSGFAPATFDDALLPPAGPPR